MADLDRLQRALVAADAAGDVDASRSFAAAIRQAQPPAKRKPFNVLPFSEDEAGNVSFDSDAGIVGAIKRAVTLPGDVFTGRVDPNSPEVAERAFEFATTASPAGVAARAGERAIPGVMKALRKPEVEPPSAEALKQASSASYDRARNMGVEYPSEAVKNLADETRRALESEGILAELTPKTFKILSKLNEPPEGSFVTVSGIDAARRALGHAAADFANPTEQLAARQAMERLDEFLMGGNAAGSVARTASPEGASLQIAGPGGDPAAEKVAQLIRDARGNYAAAKRSERLTGAQDRAELNAAVANSGQNIDNQLRQRMRDILTRPKEARGYSKEELGQIEQIARGTPATNTARFVGNLLGGGGGLGAVVSGGAGGLSGAAFGGPAGAIIGAGVPAVGYGSKKLASALVNRQIGKVNESVRRRSPLYEQILSETPMEAISPERRAALVRALLLSEMPEQ